MARESNATAAAKDAAQDARTRNLKIVLGQIEKEFGKGSIIRLGDQGHQNVPTISTGSMALDIATGIGGVPRGRIIEIYGPESSGKTTLCLHVIANAQKAGGTCAFIDTEHALDPRYARVIGVDTDNLLVSQPDCGEDALNIAETLVRSNAIDVVIVDSVAALFTNQIREKIGVMFGNPETTTGGRALKFYASMRMEIRRTGVIKAPDGKTLGNKVKVKLAKNKLAAPFQECEFDVMFNEGISKAGSILAVALDMKIIEKRGSWFSFGDMQIAQGAEQTKNAIKSDQALQDKIVAKIRENLDAKGGAANANPFPQEDEPADEGDMDPNVPVDQL